MMSDPPDRNEGSSQYAWSSNLDNSTNTPVDQNVGKGTFVDQFKALMIRNLTLKKRDRRKTLTVRKLEVKGVCCTVRTKSATYSR